MAFWSNWGRSAWREFDSGDATGAVELTKRNSSISLTKQGAASGNLRINLSWQMRTSDFNSKGTGPRPPPLQIFKPQVVQAQGPAMVNVDLDLAVMYELKSGAKGVVQPLGDFFGNLNEAPCVKLSGDDRFGAGMGETIYINLDHKDDIKRLLVFVYIYDGPPAFDRTHGMVTLYPSNGPRVEIAQIG